MFVSCGCYSVQHFLCMYNYFVHEMMFFIDCRKLKTPLEAFKFKTGQIKVTPNV